MSAERSAVFLQKLLDNPKKWVHISLKTRNQRQRDKRRQTYDETLAALNVMGIRHEVGRGLKIKVL